MAEAVSVLYGNELPVGYFSRMEELFVGQQVQVFFRADDIGRPDPAFTQMMELFLQHEVPLCLAVVPKWLTREHWQAMACFFPEKKLWCWHQHGYAHINHEPMGKKNEFGPSRSRVAQQKDLLDGQQHLAEIMGDLVCPVFTPPWNRCCNITLELLRELRFAAVSRSTGGEGIVPGFPDVFVTLDLHTGKAREVHQAAERVLRECRQGVASGRLGVMLHHLRMNEQAFSFLARFIDILKRQQGVRFVTFRELLAPDHANVES